MADIGKAYLQILPSMRGFRNQLEAGGTPGVSGAAGKWGGIIKGALATAGIAAVATGMKKLISTAGQYEQTVGGVKKIFNEINYDIIEKDANNAYKTMGMSAQEYQDMLNNVGATLTASLGDKKAYTVAKDGMTAISDYATGTGKNMDELSTKWQMINRGAGTYQSIADQFSGLLPQTTKDFLEQAQQAGYLSEEYTKLSEVPIAEYQEALSKMAIQGTEDLGLLGNTAAEAEDTLSGSFESMRASFSNFMSDLTSGDTEGAKESFNTLWNTSGDFFTNAKSTLETTFDTLGTVITDEIKTWGDEEDQEALSENIDGLNKEWDKLQKHMDGISFKGVLDQLGLTKGSFEQFKTDTAIIFTGIGKVFLTGTNLWIETAKGAYKEIKWFLEKIKGVFEDIKDFFEGIGDKLNLGSVAPRGRVGKASATIPALAEGGIVTRPTLALIGEAGAEAVVPLNGKHTMGNTYYITINSTEKVDEKKLAQEIDRRVKYAGII